MSTGTRRITPRTALNRLRRAFQRELGIGAASARGLLGGAILYDKAYELSCLTETMKALRVHMPGVSFVLRGGPALTFRTKGGPIVRGAWAFIELVEQGDVEAELWVDIECTALSAWRERKSMTTPSYGLAHELDIVLVAPGTSGRPTPDMLHIVVEAKHRPFNKALLKELLGVRRETAFKGDDLNLFAWWIAGATIPATPPCGLVLFCSNASVIRYTDPARYWGIKMVYHPY